MINNFSFLPSEVKGLVFNYTRDILDAEKKISPVHQIQSLRILIRIQSVCKEWFKLSRESSLWQGIAVELNISLNASISLKSTSNDSSYEKVILAIQDSFCQKYENRYSSPGDKISHVFNNLLSLTDKKKVDKPPEAPLNPFDSFKKISALLSKPETLDEKFEKLRVKIQKNPEPLFIQSIEDHNFIDFKAFFEKNPDYMVPEKMVKMIFMAKEVPFILFFLDQPSVNLLTYNSSVIFDFLKDTAVVSIESLDAVLQHPKMTTYLTENYADKGKLFNEFLFFEHRKEALLRCLWLFVLQKPDNKIIDIISNLLEKSVGSAIHAILLLTTITIACSHIPANQDVIKKTLLNKIDPVWGFTWSQISSFSSLFTQIGVATSVPFWDLTGKNVNIRGREGLTPLTVLCSCNAVEAVIVLITLGGDIEAQCESNRTPLYYACKGGAVDVVKLLLKNGVNTKLYENGHNIFLKAAQNNPEILSLLAAHL